jgi:hypothetical protein
VARYAFTGSNRGREKPQCSYPASQGKIETDEVINPASAGFLNQAK